MSDKIFLSEAPHFVIQGEGNLIGKKMLLFRVAGCNLKCKNCDSAYTWNESSDIYFTLPTLNNYIKEREDQFDFVMITGGAPSLYKDFIYNIIFLNPKLNFQIEDAGDTNWSNFKNFDNVWFSFSPKIGALESSSSIEDWNAFKDLPRNFICKIVVDSNDWNNNYESVLQFQYKYHIPDNKIYLMPIGIRREKIIEQSKFLVDKIFELNNKCVYYNFSTRLHILLYDNKRMV